LRPPDQILEEQPSSALDLLETSLLVKRTAAPPESGGVEGAVPVRSALLELPRCCALLPLASHTALHQEPLDTSAALAELELFRRGPLPEAIRSNVTRSLKRPARTRAGRQSCPSTRRQAPPWTARPSTRRALHHASTDSHS